MEEAVKAPELIAVVATRIHNVHPTGTGTINALVSLSCKGIALVQNLPSITEGQVVQVTREQVVGNVGNDDVAAAYQKGVEDTKLKAKEEAKKSLEKMAHIVEDTDEELLIDLTEEEVEKVVSEVIEETAKPLLDKIGKVLDTVVEEEFAE